MARHLLEQETLPGWRGGGRGGRGSGKSVQASRMVGVLAGSAWSDRERTELTQTAPVTLTRPLGPQPPAPQPSV